MDDLSEKQLDEWWAIADRVPHDLWLDGFVIEPRCPMHPRVFGFFFGWLEGPRGRAAVHVTGRLAESSRGEPVIRDLAIERDYRYEPAEGPDEVDVVDEPDDRAGIDGDLLRALSIPKIREQALARLAVEPDLVDFAARVGWASPTPEEVEAAKRAAARATTSRRRGYPDEHYEAIARMYVGLVRRGRRKGLYAEMGRLLGHKPERIRDWVHRATELGYLMPGRPGAVSARPGPRLTNRTEER